MTSAIEWNQWVASLPRVKGLCKTCLWHGYLRVFGDGWHYCKLCGRLQTSTESLVPYRPDSEYLNRY